MQGSYWMLAGCMPHWVNWLIPTKHQGNAIGWKRYVTCTGKSVRGGQIEWDRRMGQAPDRVFVSGVEIGTKEHAASQQVERILEQR